MAPRLIPPRGALLQRIASELSDAAKVQEKVQEAAATAVPAAAAAEPPRGPVEEVIAEIWGGVLGRDGIGRRDGFFALGGHSLAATRMLSRLHQAFGVEISLGDLFELATVAALAKRIGALTAGHTAGPPPRPGRRSRQERLPLSYAQERYWLLAQLDPEDSSYNQPLLLELGGSLDVAALAAGLDFVAGRHEALRTVFTNQGGAPAQRIAAPCRRALPLCDLTALADRRREQTAARLAAGEIHRPFDLAAAPPLRCLLLRLAPERHQLLVVTHHIVFDGSAEVFLRQLTAAYADLRLRRSPAPAALPLQYADFAAWQRELYAGPRRAELLTWWRSRLAGPLPAVELPYDRPRPAEPSFRGGRRRLRLASAELAGLARLARRESATLFMTALAVFATLLGRYGDGDDVVVGTASADRPLAETEDLVGCFVDSLVLRTALGGNPSTAALIARVRDTVLAAFAHRLPFELLVEALQPERSRNRSPLFQVMFTVQGHTASRAAIETGGLVVRYPESERHTARLDLLVTLWEAGDELAGALEYSADLFDAATVERLAVQYRTLLAAAAAAPGEPAAALPLLGAAERHQLLREWNDTAAAADREVTLDELFVRQAARAPGAVALVTGDGASCTYGELDRRSAALARTLAGHGVAPGAMVAVHCDRAPGAVVALLAVLRAGGTYVPLEDRYPPARIGWILSSLAVGHLVGSPAKLAALGYAGLLAGDLRTFCLEIGRAHV